MKIRAATENDAAAIAAIVHAMGELRSVASQAISVTEDTVRLNLARMGTSGTSTAYVAEGAAGPIVGYCAVHWVPFLFFAGGEAYVTELFVGPADSGKGIGSKLIATVIEESKRRGCSRVSLLNGRDGESYRREFYKKLGWVERDRMANFVFPLPKTLSP
jgi:GNAT superfamily N-acetyltransferase